MHIIKIALLIYGVIYYMLFSLLYIAQIIEISEVMNNDKLQKLLKTCKQVIDPLCNGSKQLLTAFMKATETIVDILDKE